LVFVETKGLDGETNLKIKSKKALEDDKINSNYQEGGFLNLLMINPDK
jgi:hypothetical protein